MRDTISDARWFVIRWAVVLPRTNEALQICCTEHFLSVSPLKTINNSDELHYHLSHLEPYPTQPEKWKKKLKTLLPRQFITQLSIKMRLLCNSHISSHLVLSRVEWKTLTDDFLDSLSLVLSPLSHARPPTMTR